MGTPKRPLRPVMGGWGGRREGPQGGGSAWCTVMSASVSVVDAVGVHAHDAGHLVHRVGRELLDELQEVAVDEALRPAKQELCRIRGLGALQVGAHEVDGPD